MPGDLFLDLLIRDVNFFAESAVLFCLRQHDFKILTVAFVLQ